jgi:hypothetical protein
MNATMETAVPSVPSVPSPPNHPEIPDSSVRTLQPRLDGGDDCAALGAPAELGRSAALRATAAGQFAVQLGGGNGGKVGQKITTYMASTSAQPITANTASTPR